MENPPSPEPLANAWIRPGIEAMRRTISPQIPVIHLRTARQISAFLEGLSMGPQAAVRPPLAS
ncbi:hypothetical protein JFT81_04135 [Pseudomonas sp. TH43]|nr:hypothetical protein [Pseudomonas sp. TH43]